MYISLIVLLYFTPIMKRQFDREHTVEGSINNTIPIKQHHAVSII